MTNNNNSILGNGKRILTASIGQCVHVAGTYNFMDIATQLGFECCSLGPATPISQIIKEIEKFKPTILGLSYRLTPSTINHLLKDFYLFYKKLEHRPERIFLAGTPEVVKKARKFDFIDEFFIGGESKYQIISTLRRDSEDSREPINMPQDLISRVTWKKPYPVIRAHFGLPSFKETIEGIKKIAEAEVLDIISIAPDQNTQANYFHTEDQIKKLSGAGGVPLRSREDFIKLHEARLTGNHPMLRIYAGTRDFIRLAEMYNETINNAWAAIPIFWFNQMDGRGPLTLKESIKQHLAAIKWHADNNIPVEINDPHHWSLRDAPDAIAVADMYLCGIVAKELGVKHFIAQYMFNTPSSSSLEMDLAKILAKDELLATLATKEFNIIKQVRTGLASFPLDLNRAKGQLALSTAIQLTLRPDIVHVVSFSEANHAARPEDIIESCKIVDQVINRVYSSNIDYINDNIVKRKEELVKQAKWIIDLVPYLTKSEIERNNPFTNHKVLNRLVKYGFFDAPHLRNNPFAPGKIKTKMIDGGCYSWDPVHQKKLDEISRIRGILVSLSNEFPNFNKHIKKIEEKVMEK